MAILSSSGEPQALVLLYAAFQSYEAVYLAVLASRIENEAMFKAAQDWKVRERLFRKK